MIYILGVNHEIQHNRKLDKKFKFSVYVRNFCIKNKILTVVEEFSEDAFSFDEVHTTIIHEITENLSLKHVYCSPSREERKNFNINSFSEREDFWIKILAPLIYKGENLLLVCGNDHLKTISDKFHKKKWKSEILPKHFNYNSEI